MFGRTYVLNCAATATVLRGTRKEVNDIKITSSDAIHDREKK